MIARWPIIPKVVVVYLLVGIFLQGTPPRPPVCPYSGGADEGGLGLVSTKQYILLVGLITENVFVQFDVSITALMSRSYFRS